MMESRYSDIIAVYGMVFPQGSEDTKADAGYILPNGRVIDLNIDGNPQCHGGEFQIKPELIEWRASHPELCCHIRQAADAVMNDIGGIEFTINRLNLRAVRLPRKPLATAQRAPLRDVIARILDEGSVRVEVLGTREYAEYDAVGNTADDIMAKIDVYYASGKLPER
jgi:hypothetical protein